MPFELLVRERSDVLLFPNYLSFPSITRRPTISIVYDLAFLDCPEYVSVKNRNDLVRFVPVSIKRSSIVITISMSMRDRIIHYYPEATSKIIVVPVPAAHNKVIPSKLPINLTSRGLAPGRYILHVGTIEPRKNIESLVEAYACLPQNVRNSYALVLAGGNGWKNESIVAAIKKQQAAGLNIIQTGYVGDAVKSALYQHAACFVMPSHYEGFGMPIFEAFQRSIPVAASDIPVFREIAADAVSYFNKDNPRDISRVLTGLLQDEALQKQLVARGKERLGAYSWPENARIVTEAFERLLN
jgi:alpha-1,3-rhamnosyl/mannosyltransferase